MGDILNLTPSRPLGTKPGKRVNKARPFLRDKWAELRGVKEDGKLTGWDHHGISRVSKEWLDVYKGDKDHFNSNAVLGEAFLRQVISVTAHLGEPNPLRTAVCCVLMADICKQTNTPNGALPSLIFKELLGSIYSTNDSVPDHRETDITGYLSKTMWCDQYKAMRDSFLKYHSVAEQSSKVLSRQQMVLGRTVDTWQRMLLSRYIVAWKNTVVRIQYQQEIFTECHYRNSRRRILRVALSAWKADVVSARHGKEVDRFQKKQNSLTLKLSNLQNDIAEAASQITTLDTEKTILEEEIARLREQIDSKDLQISQKDAEIEMLKEDIVGWRGFAKRLTEEYWPGFISTDPNEYLFSEVVGKEADHLNMATKLHIRKNTLQINKDSAWLQSLPHEKRPALKLLLHWVNRAVFAANPASDLPTNLSTDYRNTLPILEVLKAITVLPENFEQKIQNEISFRNRAYSILTTVRAWRGEEATTELDITEGALDAQALLLSNLFIEFIFQAGHGGAVQHKATESRKELLKEIASCDRTDRLATFVESALAGKDQWQKISGPVRMLRESIVMQHFESRESLVFQDEAKQKEREPLVVVDPLRVADIAELNGTRAHAELRDMLLKHGELLQNTWKFYSSDGRLMTPAKFWRFISDVKATDRAFKKNMISKIYKRANSVTEDITSKLNNSVKDVMSSEDEEQQEPEEVIESYNPDDQLSATEWVDCCIHIAAGKFKEMEVLGAVEKFLLQHVDKHGCQSNVDEFRDQIYHKDVQVVLARYNTSMQRIFKYYARYEKRKSDNGTDEDISMIEYKQFLKDAKLIDSTLSVDSACELFRFLQDDQPDPISSTLGLSMSTANTTLVYREFLEVIVCIAIFKLPAPYIKLADRVQVFISAKLLPTLKSTNPRITNLKKAKN
eukprot:TRINITY_DN17443_c0_g1_i1.p1 TRINITY_DN17443_c0_g1~~TRINITY_DN17443_c0_g1_i1.p1  ORF type:complete len:924 (+),score=188.80 TRINITY_DN17443_c0_g1_i1:60-2774(+)